jgi:dihydrofolate reductase
MAQLSSFTFISLDGYYKGPGEDLSWHRHGGEEAAFSEQSLKSENILLFGRKTFEMMAAFWPTEQASQAFPVVAAGMNNAQKIVCSRTLKQPNWDPATIINDDLPGAVRRLKENADRDITILGSGSIVTQLAEEKLIDTFQIMIDPVALGAGTSLFSKIKTPLNLSLTDSKVFRSGVILLTYIPQ